MTSIHTNAFDVLWMLEPAFRFFIIDYIPNQPNHICNIVTLVSSLNQLHWLGGWPELLGVAEACSLFFRQTFWLGDLLACMFVSGFYRSRDVRIDSHYHILYALPALICFIFPTSTMELGFFLTLSRKCTLWAIALDFKQLDLWNSECSNFDPSLGVSLHLVVNNPGS